MNSFLYKILNALWGGREDSHKLEFNTTTWEIIFKHKHCPICGQVIDSETNDAYYHIYTPTRCEKMEA